MVFGDAEGGVFIETRRTFPLCLSFKPLGSYVFLGVVLESTGDHCVSTILCVRTFSYIS